MENDIFLYLPIIIEIKTLIWRNLLPSLTFKKVEFFIFDAILLKFESNHFHMFTINKLLQFEKREKENLKVMFWILYGATQKIRDPSPKFYQDEKVRPKKPMSPARIEFKIGQLINKCPLQESRSFRAFSSGSLSYIYECAVVLLAKEIN